jgi:hypothetical protein
MDILDRLQTARITACTDDRSEAGTIERERYVARHDAMMDASAEIERLRAIADAAENLLIAYGMGWDMDGTAHALMQNMGGPSLDKEAK